MIVTAQEIPHIVHSGKIVDLADLSPEDIDLEDIVISLSRIPRWTGHGRKIVTVAEHSLRVYEAVQYHKLGLSKAGLLHDAAEAYIGDIPSPFKAQVPEIAELEDSILRVIFKRFGVQWPSVFGWDVIKTADLAVAADEAAELFPDTEFPNLPPATGNSIINGWSFNESEKEFRYRARILLGAK